MTIQVGDIKLLESQVMDDVPEGGGGPTARVIQDAASNSIFPDISELDRAGGRVNLRKVFASVRTADTDGFFGVNLIVAEPPKDPRVSVTLFTTGSSFDTRVAAANRMEAYLTRGPIATAYLFGDHLAGQMNVSMLQRLEVALPVVGETFVLRKNEGLSTQFDQYVRVTGVAATERTFSDSSSSSLGDFKRLQVVLSISDQLAQDFNGFDALRFDSSVSYTGKTKLSTSIVADAARYFGVVPVQVAAQIGDFSVKAESIYTQLVPSTRVEVPIADARMNQQSATLVRAGQNFSRTLTLAFTTGQSMHVGGGILPGSLSVARGGITITDKGPLLVDASGSQVGTVDHANGVLALTTNVFGAGAGSHDVSYALASAPLLVSESLSELVTQAGQRMSYALSLDPPPARGTLRISYCALGNWYELRDDGSGALRGADASFGAGTLNYSTGTISATLGALPDVDSSVIYTFVPSTVSRPITAIANTGPALPRAFGKPITLGKAIKPGTLAITWNDGSARSATDAGGVLSGDASGIVNYAEGFIDLRPNTLPPKGTAINVALTEAVQAKANVAHFTDAGGHWSGTLATPLKAGTVELSVVAYAQHGGWPPFSLRVFDNGSGSLQAATPGGNITVGTLDYGTGAFTLTKTMGGYEAEQPVYAWEAINSGAPLNGTGGGSIWAGERRYIVRYEVQPVPCYIWNGPGTSQVPAPAWAWWSGSQGNAAEVRNAAADAPVFSGSAVFDSIFLPANAAGFGSTSTYAADISAFRLGGAFHIFGANNSWQLEPSPTTGQGTEVGAKGVIGGMSGVLLTSWPAGAAAAPIDIAGASQPDLAGPSTLLEVTRATFRTAVAPLVSGGFQIAGHWRATGTAFTASAAASGTINTGTAAVGETPGSLGVFGSVNYEMGVATVYFGRRVPASMAGEDFVADLSYLGIVGVAHVQVLPVQADTLRYNAVGYSYLPLDPVLLGLNPVRLPADGRVPIFRPGSFAVIGHTGKVPAATYTAGQTVDCARVRLSRVRLVGADGQVIDGGYTADLDLGLVAIDDVTGWVQPVEIEHRIEDMLMVRDAQINGQLTFTRAITHDYPVPGSYISSAMVAGDVRARTSLVFDQISWTNEWSDAPIGDPANATFNHAQNPITVTNRGALTERWAVRFKSSTDFEVLGEHVGVIAVGNTGSDCAPLNPAAGLPYLTIPAAGWGLGWAVGNVLRINTVGAMVPVWVARTILQGPETVPDDKFTLLIRGDVDRP